MRSKGRTAIVWWLFVAVGCGLLLYGHQTWLTGASGQPIETQPAPSPEDAERIAREAAALDEHANAALLLVDEMLERFPAAATLSLERRSALMMLDAVLRDPNAAQRPAVQRFFHRRIERALAQVRRPAARPGVTVWQIYNQGFVARTASETLCFDIVRPRYLPGFALPDGLIEEFAAVCDVLFVSHVHADHAEDFVADSFVARGKPVVAPAQIGYPDALYARITHLEPAVDKVHAVPMGAGRAPLQVVVFPGHQGEDIDNNVVLVTTSDGFAIMHTGDQWRLEDFVWIDSVAVRHAVDILLPNDWTLDIGRMVRGVNPALVVPGHANELGHGIEKRQPYWLSIERKRGSARFGGNRSAGYAHPMVLLAWGESVHYERVRAAR